MSEPTVLLVDDEEAIRYSYVRYLTRAGFQVSQAGSLTEARKVILAERLDAILLDMNLPDGNGMDWILELRQSKPEIPIVVITGAGDIPSAVEAMRRGADHFLTKPVVLADLEIFLRKSLEMGTLRRRSLVNKRLSKTSEPFFGKSSSTKEVLSLLELASENESTVILYGETGTGKGVYARWIFQHSPRSSMPFVEVNCSSLRGELLSNELFGHVRGAFTSAMETREGLLDVADGGTLFLDEIGDMDAGVQSQMLKVLEEKRYRRLGDVQERRSEFRLICATNRELNEEVKNGNFRKDLFFRINLIPIQIPPLRERKEELPDLIQYLLAGLVFHAPEITPRALQMLVAYSWPGNVRELRNVVERAVLLARGQMPLDTKHFPGLETSRTTVDASELERIQDALKQSDGDKQRAAEILGMSRATLYRKLKSLGL